MFLKKFFCSICCGHYFSVIAEVKDAGHWVYKLRCKECHTETFFDTDRQLRKRPVK
jgi:transcription elongation factor Elf1